MRISILIQVFYFSISLIAVSYTHLDVYKRQEVGLLMSLKVTPPEPLTTDHFPTPSVEPVAATLAAKVAVVPHII